MQPEDVAELGHLRRARDLIDRDYAKPLDVPSMAEVARMSPAHFSRRFRDVYDETPYQYLLTRRIERAQLLLRRGLSVTDAALAVGWASLGSFSTRFVEVTGHTPSSYRTLDHQSLDDLPSCMALVHLRPPRTRA